MKDTHYREKKPDSLPASVHSLLPGSISRSAFYLTHPDGRIRTWNRGAQQLLGYSPEEAIARPMDFIFTGQDRLAGLPQKMLETCRKSGEVQSEGWWVRKGGDVFWGSLALAPVYDDESRLIGWSHLIEDKSQQKAVQDAFEDREATITALFDSAAQGILAVDATGKIVWANPMSAEMFGYTQSEIANLLLDDLLPHAFCEKHKLEVNRYFSKPWQRPMGIGMDLTGRRKGGEEFPIEVSLSPLNTQRGVLAVAFISDISERKKSEQLLARSEAMHRMLFEQTPQPMWVHDDSGRFLMVNEAAVALYGYSRDEFLQMTVGNLGDPAEATPSPLAKLDHRITHHKKDRTVIFVDQHRHAIQIGEKSAHLVLVTDITQRIELEKAIAAERNRFQALAGRMREIQEQERLHLSREIHDTVGQELTGLKLSLHQLAVSVDASAPELALATTSIDRMIVKLRDIAAHLRPPVLDKLDLPDALEWLSEDFAERARIECRAHIQRDFPSVRDEVKLAAFHVCQEALTNVHRHARASKVTVSLASRDDEMTMTIEDDGVGFSRDVNPSGSLGLLAMRERAESLRGYLAFASAPGEGTRILLSIPLGAP